jgi:hypothetical protein
VTALAGSEQAASTPMTARRARRAGGIGTVGGTLRVAYVLSRILAPGANGSPAARADDTAVEVRIRLDHGVWRSGTQVEVDRFGAVAHSGGVLVEGALGAQARVDDGGTGHLNVEASGLRVAEGASRSVRAVSVSASVASRDLDLAALVHNGLDVPGSVEAQDVVARFEETTLAAPRFSVAATAARFRPGAEPLAGTIMRASRAPPS